MRDAHDARQGAEGRGEDFQSGSRKLQLSQGQGGDLLTCWASGRAVDRLPLCDGAWLENACPSVDASDTPHLFPGRRMRCTERTGWGWQSQAVFMMALAGPDPADVPMMLSMNTRVQRLCCKRCCPVSWESPFVRCRRMRQAFLMQLRCPVCMTMQPDLLRCPTCRNVGYCSQGLSMQHVSRTLACLVSIGAGWFLWFEFQKGAEHLQADAGRHKFWCSQDVKGPK